MSTVFEASYTELKKAKAEIARLRHVLQWIIGTTHRPNPTDQSRIDVAPGNHRHFQAGIERAIKLIGTPAE